MQAVEAKVNEKLRSGCPVSLGLDIFGDRWTLLIVRDLMFGGKRHFREMLHSDERISSNVLADRLNMLVLEGIVSKTEDPRHLQKVIYSLTEKGIALLPILLEISRWSYQYRPVGEAFMSTDAPLELKDTAMWMRELRKTHLVQSDVWPSPA